MKIYVVLWKAKTPWHNLTVEARDAYIGPLSAGIKQLIEEGLEVISWGANDGSNFNNTDYDFFAIWKFSNEQLAKSFENMIVGTGWFNYFDQVNLLGDALSPQDVIGKMVEM